MALPQKFDDWKFTKRVIRITHNREVRKYFKDVPSDTARTNGRQAIKTALIIRDDDSAIEILNKQFFFRFGLTQSNITSQLAVPEAWTLKPGFSIPQLVVIYRPDNVKRGGNYTLTIPHYTGDRSPNAPRYTRGNYRVVWVLKDNSSMIINAVSESEGRFVITQLKQYVNKRMWTDDIRVTERSQQVIRRKYSPIRADFFKNGRSDATPTWRYYYPS